jgi:predicted DNA-binding protein (MmcQ/YjbR family)
MKKISDYRSIEKYLLSKKGSCRDFPFGPDAPVYRVCNKMFAIMNQDNGISRLNLKCDPEDAEVLRSIFKAVKPGYHMNKQHWNSVYLDGSIPEGAVCQMIDDSYDLVVKGLKKSDREKLISKNI